ncbi:MAG TPA: hypothetical protein VLH77_01890 [Gammaproteobacteria bacterium]|nr:hypothetical protein [Gammaproteobacteria bacterium]
MKKNEENLNKAVKTVHTGLQKLLSFAFLTGQALGQAIEKNRIRAAERQGAAFKAWKKEDENLMRTTAEGLNPLLQTAYQQNYRLASSLAKNAMIQGQLPPLSQRLQKGVKDKLEGSLQQQLSTQVKARKAQKPEPEQKQFKRKP